MNQMHQLGRPYGDAAPLDMVREVGSMYVVQNMVLNVALNMVPMQIAANEKRYKPLEQSPYAGSSVVPQTNRSIELEVLN